ncbi:hypothetical protein AOCH_004809 [Aspergillus ochraceoroseus]|uniref:DUF202 domain-containing protein n=1 Tax=Aspergillus ochraceoroseus TaxID=138278 RepID=A0A0F8WTN9_9EURO|nr:hypothetical protein AOCH_004809 [Aspergillus ochraceoroseus]
MVAGEEEEDVVDQKPGPAAASPLADAADPVGSPSAPGSSLDTSAHTEDSHGDESDESDRDAYQLHEIETQRDDDDSTGSISSGEYRITTRRTVSRTSRSSRGPRKGVLGRIQRLWTRNVVLTVPQKKNRDYFALERTFLAYIRTSVVLAMQGVLIAQLFRLGNASSPQGLGYHEVGIPLSVTCHCAAILTALLGAHRFWKQQGAIAVGIVYAGGWELNCIAALTTGVSATARMSIGESPVNQSRSLW